jgi:hypothetical protein
MKFDPEERVFIIPGQEPPQKAVRSSSGKKNKTSLLEKVLAYQDPDSSNIQSESQSDQAYHPIAPSETDLEEEYKLAREDFLRFAVLVDEFPVAPIHVERDEHIKTHDRAVIIGPQGHGKTTLESILRPVWYLGKNANERIKIVTISDSKARDILSAISDLIEKPTYELSQIFPDLRPNPKGPWSAQKLTVERSKRLRDVSVEATGILSSPTGGRATILIFDDIIDANSTIKSPGLMKLIRRAFFSLYLPLLEPGGRLIYICTPWTDDDLTTELEEKWGVLKQAIPQNLESIWPQVWSTKELEGRLEDMGMQDFNRAYRAIPLIRRKNKNLLYDMPDITPNGLDPEIFFEKAKKCTVKIGAVDLSSTKKTKSYSAIVILGVNEEAEPEQYYLLNARRDNYNQLALIEELADTWTIWQPEMYFVESNACQLLVVEWLQIAADTGIIDIPDIAELVFEPIFTTSDKHDPNMGLPALGRMFSQNRFWYPKYPDHPKSCDCASCLWIQEIGDPRNAITNDLRIATWMAWKGYRSWTLT